MNTMDNVLEMSEQELERHLQALAADQDRREQFISLAKRAWFDATRRLLMVELNNRMIISVPVELCQELAELSDEQLAQVEIVGGGYTLLWRESGAGADVSALLAGRFGSRKWMGQMRDKHGIPLGIWPESEAARSEWGKIAGSSKSEAKAEAARKNGQKGGRPRKNPTVASA